MATSTDELKTIEEEALAHLASESGHVEEDLDEAANAPEQEEPQAGALRPAIAVAMPVIAAAVMVGGVFTGVGGRIYAALAGILGVGLAVGASRLRKAVPANLAIFVGLFAIGLIAVAPAGVGNLGNLRSLVVEAAKSGDVLRPPVPLTAGWQAIIGWLMGIVGFTGAWLALPVRRPSLGLLVPLPIAAIAGISVPKNAQTLSGVAALVLFAIGLGVLSSTQTVGNDDEKPSAGYEVRRALRALPFIVLITVAVLVLDRVGFLFPDPYIDPTQEPQKPKTVPLSDVEDRVLFDVEASITGPWRIGSLDVYDGKDWRLPPFAENELANVPRSGVVNTVLQPGVKARFSIAGLTGVVLPGLPNPVGIVAEGPKLAYDDRSGNIRVAQGQIQAGLVYTVTAAALPTIDTLRNSTSPLPKGVAKFLDISDPPPPAVQSLLDEANEKFTNNWDKFDFLRTHILDNVTAAGTGVPKSVPPERVQDMLAGSKEGSPYEIVAAQAMLARWLGVPSRIGYGFDGGEVVNDRLQVRPKNGASFVEVFFAQQGWLPVIGVPKKAKPTVGSDPSTQQFDPSVLPSDDVTVQVFLPLLLAPDSILVEQIRNVLFIAVPILLLLFLAYLAWPGVQKLIRRSRRRSAAEAAGSRARIALAYAEWRDAGTDFGFRHDTDTPLQFLERFADDDEHTEFAWLVTRCLWGDLQHDLDAIHASVTEELSRSLRSRLSSAQPATVRVVSAFSRLSLRHPYAPDTDLTPRAVRREQKHTKQEEKAHATVA